MSMFDSVFKMFTCTVSLSLNIKHKLPIWRLTDRFDEPTKANRLFLHKNIHQQRKLIHSEKLIGDTYKLVASCKLSSAFDSSIKIVIP